MGQFPCDSMYLQVPINDVVKQYLIFDKADKAEMAKFKKRVHSRAYDLEQMYAKHVLSLKHEDALEKARLRAKIVESAWLLKLGLA